MGHSLDLLETVFQIRRESSSAHEKRENKSAPGTYDIIWKFLSYQGHYYVHTLIIPILLFDTVNFLSFFFFKHRAVYSYFQSHALSWSNLSYVIANSSCKLKSNIFFSHFEMLSYLSLHKIWFVLNEGTCLHTDIHRSTNIHWSFF